MSGQNFNWFCVVALLEDNDYGIWNFNADYGGIFIVCRDN